MCGRRFVSTRAMPFQHAGNELRPQDAGHLPHFVTPSLNNDIMYHMNDLPATSYGQHPQQFYPQSQHVFSQQNYTQNVSQDNSKRIPGHISPNNSSTSSTPDPETSKTKPSANKRAPWHPAPWYTKQLRELKDEVQILWRQFKYAQKHNPEYADTAKAVYEKYNGEYLRIRRKTQREYDARQNVNQT